MRTQSSPRSRLTEVVITMSCLMFLAACATNIQKTSTPAELRPAAAPAQDEMRILAEDVQAHLRPGYEMPRLRSGTRWRYVGRIDQGRVFEPIDTALAVGTVIPKRQANLVERDGLLVGVFLTNESAFVDARVMRTLPWRRID